jgi:hydrogenase/urease accessory protein HupE
MTRRCLPSLWLALCTLLWWGAQPLPAQAHEIRPAYLELREHSDGTVDVLWRQPVAGEYALPLQPVLSSGWLAAPPERRLTADTLSLRWRLSPASGERLEGQWLEVRGLERSITDVWVRWLQAEGPERSWLLKPVASRIRLGGEAGTVAGGELPYFRLGFDHLLEGIDHLLFVAALALLLGAWRQTAVAVSAFTMAHSLTLALATLGWLVLPTGTLETLIALSIVVLAVELLRDARGQPGWGARYPALLAFGFGLLHGLGFAGALADIGLPREDLAWALLRFNLGIEAGQLLFVVLVLGVVAALRRWPAAQRLPWRSVSAWLVGITAATWFWGRLVDLS